MRFIGIDVHKDSCTCVVLGPSGRKTAQAVVETSERGLRTWLATIPRPWRIAIEECTQSGWLYEVLSPQADEVVVAIPDGKRGRVKDDLRDALDLAEKLRVGALPRRVFKEVRPVSLLRAKVRTYYLLREDVVRTKNRLMAVFRSRGIRGNSQEIYDGPDQRQSWLKRLPKAQRVSAEFLGEELDAQTELLHRARVELETEGRGNADVSRLQTMTELGPIRAATIVALVVTPWRFPRVREYWSYCGLAIVYATSGEWYQRQPPPMSGGKGRIREAIWTRRERRNATRGLNHNRVPLLKETYKSTAVALATRHDARDEPLVERHQRRVRNGMDTDLSLLTMARQLADISLQMWKHKEEYDPKRLKRST